MTSLDLTIIVGYFLIVVGLGCFAGRGQRSLRDYFLGGQSVPWWAAMASGIATIVSAVSYLGAPGVSYHGDYTLHQYRLGLPVVALVLCGIMIPRFYRRQHFSIYQYLEERFDLRTRLAASGVFIVLKLCYLAVVIYAPALVMEKMFGWPTMVVMLFVGCLTTVYTVIGGIKGVIWTDTLQLLVLMGGLVVVFLVALAGIDGGLATVWSVGQSEDKFRFLNPSWSLTERYTVIGGLVGGSVYMLAQYGTDQAELQRFLTTRSRAQANVALLGTLAVTFAFGLFVFLIGTTIWVFYRQHAPGAEPIASNEVMPIFILNELPSGIRGLLVAGVLSAAMSTISTVINSLTTVAVADFHNRFARTEATLRQARGLSLIVGVTGMILALFASRLGNILELTIQLSTLFGGPLVGTFLAGMLFARTSAAGAFWGLVAGFVLSMTLTWSTSWSFLWVGAFAVTPPFVLGQLMRDRRSLSDAGRHRG